MLAHRTYKYRLYPTHAQESLLDETLDLCRELYNAALQERRDAYRMAGKTLTFAHQSAELPECKRWRPELGRVFSQTLQNVLHRVDTAFQAFFRRVKAGEKPGYPRFQGRERYDSFTYPQLGWSLLNDRLTLSKIGTLGVKLHRPVGGKVKTVTIKREGRQWYVCFAVEYEVETPVHSGAVIGIDLGLEHFANLSNGEQVDNPRYFRQGEKHLAKVQRRLSRTALRSPRRKKLRRRVANAHSKVRRQRRDFLHKQSRRLVDSYRLIAVENLNIKGLAGGMLAKSVNDAGWASFIAMLRYKAEWAGTQLIEVDPRYTSQTCPHCGAIRKKELAERWHKCACGFECHRDIAAALVILARGLASLGIQPLDAMPL